MGSEASLGHQLTLYAMPFLMMVGAIMSLGAAFYLPPFVLLLAVFALVVGALYSLKGVRPKAEDARFLIVPVVVLALGTLTEYHLAPAFYDQAYHLQISNRILDRWTWEPTHQGMSYSFRPEIVSGVAAVELFLSGKITEVFVVPTLFLITAAWSIQHLAEYLSDKRFGFLAGVVFCTFPVSVLYGRTMLLDTALAGMVISTLHHLVTSEDEDQRKFVVLGVLLAIVGMTKYAYLYLGPWICLMYLGLRKSNSAKWIAFGYLPTIVVFLFKNKLRTGAILGPLQSQVTGTFASVNTIANDESTYTLEVFLTEFIAQWQPFLLCVALYGSALLMKHRNRPYLFMWMAVMPAVVLHGYVLDFGWARYSTPWLAMLGLGVPATFVLIKDEYKGRFQKSKLPVIATVLILLGAFQPALAAVEDMGSHSEWRKAYRSSWVDIYQEVGETLPKETVIITTRDITMGLHAQTPTYCYEDPNYAILQAVEKFDATHLFTQQSGYLFEGHVDINTTFLFGSPIEPVSKHESNGYVGYLWEVNDTRLQTANHWQNTTLNIIGTGEQSGDFLWLNSGSTVELPESTAIRTIYETPTDKNLDEIHDVLSNNRTELLCDSIASCSGYDRNERLGTNWAVWLVEENESSEKSS